MANPRTKARLEARIQERVAYCLEFELSDPRSAFVTVTKVELNGDLSTARVYFSVYGTQGERSRVMHMLEGATGFVRSKVARVLRVLKLPKITWVYDDSVEYAAKMGRAIQEALERDRQINPDAHPTPEDGEAHAKDVPLDHEPPTAAQEPKDDPPGELGGDPRRV